MNKIRQLREAKKLTQANLAKRLNLDNIALIEVPATKFWQLTCEDDPGLLQERYLSSYLPYENKIIVVQMKNRINLKII